MTALPTADHRFDDLADALVLDGGLSNALEDRGADLSSDLWTARLLTDDPDEIVAVHAAYFTAGADVATTASYQPHRRVRPVDTPISPPMRCSLSPSASNSSVGNGPDPTRVV